MLRSQRLQDEVQLAGSLFVIFKLMTELAQASKHIFHPTFADSWRLTNGLQITRSNLVLLRLRNTVTPRGGTRCARLVITKSVTVPNTNSVNMTTELLVHD
ncbi:hypothetical protein PF003_g16552 [Phytophthora fragariae]|nr:hypothetical protein PF003_g16552 [Phytophthora fragariae]